MKKNKKIIIIIIILCLIIVGLLLYFLVFNTKPQTYSTEKIIRYYSYEKDRYNEYKYICKKNSCVSKALTDNNYLLTDDSNYIYNPIENTKTKVDVEVDKVYTSLKDKDGKIVALVLSDNGSYDGNKTMYLIEDNKVYLNDKNYSDISLLSYDYYEENSDEEKHIIINYDYVIASDSDYNTYVIDYKKDEVIFDSKKLDYKSKEKDYSVNFEIIKVKDDLFYYKVACGEGISYLLNENFKVISTYSSKGLTGQWGEGNQFEIYKDKVYIVNTDDKTFSIYNLKGKLIKKSDSYKKVYCVAHGYILVRTTIDEEELDVVIDSNGKELFRAKKEIPDISVSMYYNEENNSLVVDYIGGLDSGYYYSYSFKTGSVTEKNYDYMDGDY